MSPRRPGLRPAAGPRWALSLVLGGAVALAAGCAGNRTQPGEAGASFAVGTNRVGDPCTLIRTEAPPQIAAAGAAYYQLQCGKWERPSGSVFVVAGGSGAARALAEAGWWHTRLGLFLNCGAPEPTSVLDGVPAVALDCRLKSGDWPYQALALELDGKVYLGDAIPSAYQPLELAVGVLAGRLAASDAGGPAGTSSAEMRRLEGRLAGADYRIQDITQYNDLRRLARFYNVNGEYARAEAQYRKAWERAQTERPDQEAYLAMHIALELSNQQRFAAADAMFERARRALPRSPEPALEGARLIGYQGLHLANQRRNPEAIAAARTAAARFAAAGYGSAAGDLPAAAAGFTSGAGGLHPGSGVGLISFEDGAARGNAAKSLHLEASLDTEEGRFDEALRTLAKARGILATDPQAPGRWGVELNVLEARIAEKQGQYGRAASLLSEAIDTEQSLFGESRVGALAYIALGRVQAARDRRGAALRAFRRGFAILAHQGGRVRIDEVVPYLRLGQAEAQASPGSRDALYRELFEVGQLVSGPVVNQAIAQLTARLASGNAQVGGVIRELQDAEGERERLRNRIDVLQADPQSYRGREAELAAQWRRLNEAIDDLQRQVQVAAPRYPQLLLAQPVTAAAVQEALTGDEALSQVLIGADGGFGFLVDQAGIQGYPIDLTEAQAVQYVKELRAAVEDPADLPAYPVERAHALYQRLYGPVAGRLATRSAVVTVPSGALLSLPFALLVTAPPPRVEGLDYSQVPWMVQRQALTLSPSVQSWVNLRTNVAPSHAQSPFIGFGDALSGGDAAGVMRSLGSPSSCAAEANLIANAPPLPDTAFELREIAKTLGASDANLSLGRNFTKAAVRGKDLANYRVISFATHGLLPSKLQCLPEPALLVTPAGRGGVGDNALLMSSEVVELKMDADVVVLSACDTGGGAGRASGGEALSGLARAFFFAGARNLLVSHWEVPSAATTELLVRTFEGTSRSGRSLGQAMRQAQQGIIATRSYSHPKAWAGFSVVGPGS